MSTQATEAPALADEDEIAKADRLVMAAEEAVDEIARRLFEVTNYRGEQDVVTPREIGYLFIFIRDVERTARRTLDTLKKIDEAASIDLAEICREGRSLSIPRFDAHGNDNYSPGGIERYEKELLAATRS